MEAITRNGYSVSIIEAHIPTLNSQVSMVPLLLLPLVAEREEQEDEGEQVEVA